MKKLFILLVFIPFISFAQEFISKKQSVTIGFSTHPIAYNKEIVIKIINDEIEFELPDSGLFLSSIIAKRKFKKDGYDATELKTKNGCIIYIYKDYLFMNLSKFNNAYISYYLENYIEPTPEEKAKSEELADYNLNIKLYGKFNADCIKEKKVKIGMKDTAVLKILGVPQSINKTEIKTVISEQWIYDNINIYLDNGIVTAIQQHLSNE